MKTKTLRRLFSMLAALVMGLSLLTGCSEKNAERTQEQEDAQTIQVYLWSTSLYENYAPYVQSQLPDVNIEFIVGNNDLDFYKFLQQNGGLPDIITCCRFSLHDAAPLKDSLMNLAMTNEAGAVYNTYLNSFKNEDGSVNWLPVCADAHGFVVNRSLFEQYDIPLPTDYASFVAACQAFEKVGIRGFTSDYTYDYTCMETLQGLSAAELTTTAGRKWRTTYSDPASTARVGLDDTVWPGAFERMEQFIQDTHLTADDLALNYDDVTGMFRNGEVAMYFGSSAGVKMFQDEGIDTIFLPFFSQNSEPWIMTTPYFQVALNRDLEQDTARREKAMKVLNVMLSEQAQNRIVSEGQDILSYSQNVPLRLTEYLKDVRSVVEENHMYIRIASNDFFAVSKDVVSKMIAGELTAEQAYQAFNAQLLADEEPADNETVLTSGKAYSNVFHANGGSASFSVMANTLRGNDFFYDFYEEPEDLKALLDYCADALVWNYEKQMEAAGDVYGGVVTGFGEWLPGRGLGHVSEDTTTMISLEQFEEFGRPRTERIFRKFDEVFIHMHALSERCLASVASLPNIRLMELSSDPNTDRAVEVWKRSREKLTRVIPVLRLTRAEIESNMDLLKSQKTVVWYDAACMEDAQDMCALFARELPVR